MLLELSAQESMRAAVASNERTANQQLDQNKWNLIFMARSFAFDDNMSKTKLMARIKCDMPEVPVIITAESGTSDISAKAIAQGSADFLTRPISPDCIGQIIDMFLPRHSIDVAESRDNDHNIIGQSACLRETMRLATKVAPTSAPVLLTGESGTGKELIAQMIHNESKRANACFIKVNCAALSDSLLESELFGHEKGAFTGAIATHKGRFERAHGGTLLLDEITETKPSFQANLLRVLEQMDFERVGGTENINVNVRIISTTNTDILSEVEKGNFRADLYYRLSAIRFVIPPLRDRKDDLGLLIRHFVNSFAYEAGRSITAIDPEMLNLFEEYHWPGNIRQLKNVLRTALIIGSGNTLSLDDTPWLSEELRLKSCDKPLDAAMFAGTSLQKLEQQAILATLEQTGGNQVKASKILGITDRTLRDKVKRYKQQDQPQLSR
jgi:DNA-binding NtrC family response regulator